MTEGMQTTFFATSGGGFFPSFPCKRESILLFVGQIPALPCEDGFPLSRE